MAVPPSLPPVSCPHCGASNPVGAAFCESCGKAMPMANATGPRVVSGPGLASTSVGQELQADELHKQAKKAAGALLAVAIIQTVVGGIILGLASQQAKGQIDYSVVTVLFIMAAVFWGLYFWARVQPLPAAIVGLALYGTLVVINVITSVSRMSEQGSNYRASGPFGGIGIGWLDIVIIAVLARGITAGIQYRKLMQQSAAAR